MASVPVAPALDIASAPALRGGVRFRNLPATIMVGYLLATFALFLIWPINWPIYWSGQWITLTLYVLACYATILLGFASATRSYPYRSRPVFNHTVVIVAGGLLAMIMLVPSSRIYTGRWPWEALAALADQGSAYREYQERLASTTGQRGPIAFSRALIAPFSFAAVPLAILHWRSLPLLAKAAALAAAGASLTFSLMRATDKEFADLMMAAGSAGLVLIARLNAFDRTISLLRRYWKVLVIAPLLLMLAVSIYTERKAGRLGGMAAVCANHTNICANTDSPVVSWMPHAQQFSISMFVLSTTQGYYGLSLAMEKDFQSTGGFGHSPSASNIYELLTGDAEMITRTYTYRNGQQGWNHLNFWSSLMTWVANDVGFAGAIVFLGIMAFVWGRVWRDATQGHDDAAAVLFSLLMVVVLYLPANNQVFASYDGYFILFGWIIVWLYGKGQGAGRKPA